MSIKRGRKLARICARAYEIEGNLAAAQSASPGTLGITVTDLRFVFGDPWYKHPLAGEWWPWCVAHWYTGGLEAVERDALLNLPEQLREKLNVTDTA